AVFLYWESELMIWAAGLSIQSHIRIGSITHCDRFAASEPRSRTPNSNAPDHYNNIEPFTPPRSRRGAMRRPLLHRGRTPKLSETAAIREVDRIADRETRRTLPRRPQGPRDDDADRLGVDEVAAAFEANLVSSGIIVAGALFARVEMAPPELEIR